MRLVALTTLLGALSSTAFAQIDQRIPVVVLDARGFSAGLKADAITARDLELAVDDLPTRGLGAVGGLHVYPIRRPRLALGVGGELLLARGKKQNKDTAGQPVGAPVGRRLQSIAAAVSINFGRRDGWSYLSGGMGPMLYETYLGDPADSPPRKSTINMGGGARWFFSRHLAFGFDVRFYLTRPEAIVGTSPGRERTRLLVLSGGISVK